MACLNCVRTLFLFSFLFLKFLRPHTLNCLFVTPPPPYLSLSSAESSETDKFTGYFALRAYIYLPPSVHSLTHLVGTSNSEGVTMRNFVEKLVLSLLWISLLQGQLMVIKSWSFLFALRMIFNEILYARQFYIHLADVCLCLM